MAVIDLDQLSAGLGIPVDAEKPIESLKAIYDGLKSKADAAGAVDTRLGAMEEAMKALAASGNPTPEGQAEAQSGGDPDTGRQLQSDLARAKTAPSAHELSAILRRAPQDNFEKSLHDFNDTCHLLSAVKRVAVKDLKFYQDTIASSPAMAKTLTGLGVDQSGYGADWVPVGFSGQIWEDVRLQTLVASNLVNIQMPTESYVLPYKSGTVSAYLTAELTDQTVSRMGSGKDTLDAVGIGAALWFSRNLDESAIAPIMPLVRGDITATIAEAIENGIINGDSDGSHQDYDVVGSGLDPRNAFNGYRKLCLAAAATKLDASAFSTGSTVAATCRAMRKKMGKYGVNPQDLMWLTGPSGYSQFLAATETLTMEKYGPNATLVTGELARFDGIPVVVSGQVREDVDANGVNVSSGGNNVKTTVSLINKRMGTFGVYKTLAIEDDVFILSDSILVVGKTRVDFKPRVAISATYPAAILGYNVTS